MKKQLLSLLMIMFLVSSLIAQSRDLQWIAWNNLGKRGTNSANNQNNYFFDLDNPDFTLVNVAHPDFSTSVKARNDIFVIYNDGKHYNPRFLSNPGPFIPLAPSHADDLFHNFKNDYGPEILYMYLTNRYEVDDLPKKLQVPTGHSGDNDPAFTTSLTDNGVRYVTANHDVSFLKDITLIINMDSLNRFVVDKPIILTFNTVENINTGIRDVQLILDHEPVFASAPVGFTTSLLPENAFKTPTTSGQVELKVGETSGYAYINLRPTEIIEDYGPDGDGDPQYNAVFSIIKNGNVIVQQFTEPIVQSHDPNLLRVDSICLGTDDYYTIFYHLEFENNSEIPPSSIYATVTLPDRFCRFCLTDIKWFSNGVSTGTMSSVDRKITFVFDETNISRCTDTEPTKCKGYVEFKVKVKKSKLDVFEYDRSIYLKNPIVYFDSIPYPIIPFHDHLMHKQNSIDKSSGLFRPIIMGNCFDCFCGIRPFSEGIVNPNIPVIRQ